MCTRGLALTLLFAVSALLPPLPSEAAEIVVEARGIVGEVAFTSGPDGTLFPFTSMEVGDPFTLSLRFDDAIDLDPDPDVARFESWQWLQIRSPNGGFLPGFGPGTVVIRNDQPGDGIAITGNVTMPPGITGAVTYELVLAGSDTPLSGPSIGPGNLGLLEGWDPAQATFRFDVTSDSYGDGSFVGALNVPEPGTAVLLLLGLAGCMAVRRPCL